jgi:hypothetical protein
MLLFLFIIALSIGVFIEAHFSARFRLKISPRRKTDCLFFSIQSTERTTLE